MTAPASEMTSAAPAQRFHTTGPRLREVTR